MREKFGLPVFKRDHLWSLLVVVLVLLAAGFSWFERADHAVLDYEFRLLRQYAPLAIEKDVLVVGIDEETFSAFQEPFALWHPHLGAFFQAMAVAKPSVLGLDVVLPDRSMQPVAAGYDQQLLQGLLALKTSQVPVILGQSLNNEGVPHSIFSPYVAVAGSGSRASVAICIDSDGLVRMAGGTLCDGQQVAETLSGKMAAQLGAPSGQHGLINYRLGSQFVYVPLTQVLDWLKSQDVDKLRAVFAGRGS